MKRRNAVAITAVACLLALGTLVQPLPQDQGVLLLVAGKPVDAAGQLLAQWTRLVRRCGAVGTPAAESADWLALRNTLAAYSPPASAQVQPVQMLVQGDWALAEVQWGPVPLASMPWGSLPWGSVPKAAPAQPALDPAIVPLQRRQGQWQVQAEGVWSGDTGPWHAPVLIRRYLDERVPGLPAPLRECLDPRLAPFAG